MADKAEIEIKGIVWSMEDGEITAVKIGDKVLSVVSMESVEEKPVFNEDVKQCFICNEYKPLVEFHKCKSSIDGYHSYCKSCRSFKNKEKSSYASKHFGLTREQVDKVKSLNPWKKTIIVFSEFKRVFTDGKLHKYSELSKLIKLFNTGLNGYQIIKYRNKLFSKGLAEGYKVEKIHSGGVKQHGFRVWYPDNRKISEGELPLKKTSAIDRKTVKNWKNFKLNSR